MFAIVDVFADTGFGGNPLAVVLDADRLPDHVLRQIAGEFNLSETTFVLAPRTPGSTRRLRSFTAASAEVTGAGHNALGAWWWLASTARTQTGALRQELGDAVLHLRVSQGARQAGRGDEAAAPDALRGGRHATLAGPLGVRPEQLEPSTSQVVSTGAPHLLVPARDEEPSTPLAAQLGQAYADAQFDIFRGHPQYESESQPTVEQVLGRPPGRLRRWLERSRTRLL